MKNKNILLTGKPGCGKTTIIMEVLKRLKGKETGGFFTQEIRKGKKRLGFKISSLAGREAIMAHVKFKGPHKVSKYTVNIDNLEDVGADALIKAKRDADIIVIDEIGKMELFSELVKLSILEALDSSKRVLGTIGKIKDSFVEEIEGRGDTVILEITGKNKDKLIDEIVGMLE